LIALFGFVIECTPFLPSLPEHLIECGHAKALLEAADGGFFRTLPRALQLSSLIAYPTGLSPSIGKKECDFSNWIACELPLMNRSELIWFAKEITRIVNALPLPSLAELPGESTSFTEAAPERTSLLELFIATVVAALSFEAREKVELADVAGPSQVELEVCRNTIARSTSSTLLPPHAAYNA
jgi:hypothetical protein|tara:strand:- start:543 stop:1091 length:549 start_codon:yes stop_codon:yes gene_type:complete